ncbi:MAG: nitronate monooxygenase family protein [Eubacteriales bacterium]|nr:nitronate monooxygenase family protein [Eubacteriales bacterium]
MNELQIGSHILTRPIFQGGMGIGISLGGLAGAVAKAGGAGVISAAQIGFREADFKEHPLEANLRAIPKEFARARTISPKGFLGINIMVAMQHYAEYVIGAVAAGADFIVSGAGLPVELPRLVEGSKTLIGPIVSTVKSAQVILKYWDRKYHRIPDFLVIEGPLAGGHLGFSKKQAETYLESDRNLTAAVTDTDMPAGKRPYSAEITDILAAVKEYELRFRKHIPVIIGGGISTREKAEEAFALGADAIQVATRFVTTEECDADEAFKSAYVNAGPKDIILTKSPVGMPGRAIANSFTKQVNAGKKFPPTACYGCLKGCKPKEIPYCITEALINAANGDQEHGLIFCGANAHLCTKIETVEDVMRELLGE